MAKSSSAEDELSSRMLEDVEGLEEAAKREERYVGCGSYGYVFKVKVRGMECIAKKLHIVYMNQSNVSVKERKSIFAKFRDECIMLSKLRHPNIVQFI